MNSRFGLRKQPKWAKSDIDAHRRLGAELSKAFELLCTAMPVQFTDDVLDIEFDVATFAEKSALERSWYFLGYASRLFRAYLVILDVVEPYVELRWIPSPNSDGFSIALRIENKHYHCNYLNDYVCGLTWVVGRINFHITQFVAKGHS